MEKLHKKATKEEIEKHGAEKFKQKIRTFLWNIGNMILLFYWL